MQRRKSNKRIENFDPVAFEHLMKDRGYPTARQLAKAPQCFITYETIRKALTHPEDLTSWSYFLMLHALGLPKIEIKNKLVEAGDTVLSQYIPDSKETILDDCEVATINLFKKVLFNLPDHQTKYLFDTLMFLAEENGMDIKKEIKAMSGSCKI